MKRANTQPQKYQNDKKKWTVPIVYVLTLDLIKLFTMFTQTGGKTAPMDENISMLERD